MKKLLIYLALAFSLVTLAACGKDEAAKPTRAQTIISLRFKVRLL